MSARPEILVTKWSRLSGACISQHVVNAPSSCLFQPGQHMRIRIDGEDDGGVSERRLDDRRVYVGCQQGCSK